MAHTFLQEHNTNQLPPEEWTPPPPTIYKLNIDGSFNHANGTVGIGGILHNDHGNLIQAFAFATVARSPLEAELQSLLRGTQLCVNRGVIDVLIKGDSFIIWNSLNSYEGYPWDLLKV